jgi:membrane associated rhomboid family serine protease
VLGFWFVLQIFSTLSSPEQQGGVAWGAHIGGFIGGMLLIPFFKYKNTPLFAPARRN